MTIDTEGTTSPKDRMVSLDAMRGLVMIAIIGLVHLITKLLLYSRSEEWRGFWQCVHKQMNHAYWHGLTFFDLILPLFVFVSGMTLGVAGKTLQGKAFRERCPIYFSAIRRLLILVTLGVIFNHTTSSYWPNSIEKVRFASVLGLIGFAWFTAAMVTWHGTIRTIIMTIMAIVLTLPILRCFVHPDAFGPWQFTPEGSLNAMVDNLLLPGATYANRPHDPEGIISIIASIVVSLCGVLAGKWLGHIKNLPTMRIAGLVAVGSAFVICGRLLDLFYPINKNLWTMSYVIVSTGWCAIIAALFHFLFDVIKLRILALPLIVVGANSIFVYMMCRLIDWPHVMLCLLGWSIPLFTVRFQPVAMSFYILLLQILLAAWMYKRRIFIRV